MITLQTSLLLITLVCFATCCSRAFSPSSNEQLSTNHDAACPLRRFASNANNILKEAPVKTFPTLNKKKNNDSVVKTSPPPTSFKKKNTKDSVVMTRRPKPLGTLAGFEFLLESFRGQLHTFLLKQMQRHGDCFVIWNEYVVLNNKDAIRDVLEKYNLEKTPQVKRGYRSMFYRKGGILAAPFASWIQQRRMTAPALQPKIIYSQLLPKFVQGATPILTLLQQATELDLIVEMDQVFTALTLDTIGLVLLGREFGAATRLLHGNTKPVQFVTSLNILTQEALRQMTLPSKLLQIFPPSSQVQVAKKYVDDFLEKCIDVRLRERNDGNANQTDMLNILLDAQEEGVLRRDDVKGQLLTFLFAGHDTTAHTLSWLLYEVSLNPTLQQELYEEAKLALPDYNDVVTDSDTLKYKLPLLERVWKEANRKHPAAATGTLRKVGNSPIIVGDGLELPAKASVLIPPFSLHRNEEYWPNPEVFDPSRFLPEQEEDRDNMTFQAFSAGPRNCIGSKLAQAQAMSVLAVLFRRFRVTCVERGEIADYTSLTRRPKNGIRFQITKQP